MGAGRVNAEGQIRDLLFSMEELNTCSWEECCHGRAVEVIKGQW